MHKVAALIASGSGMGADAAKILAIKGYSSHYVIFWKR